MNTESPWGNELPNPNVLVELLLRDCNFGRKQTQKHPITNL